MVEAHDVKAEDFANGGNEYYTETGGAYEKATGYMQGAAYYTLENAANIDANYYPVVYSGAKVTGSKTKDSLSEIGQNIAICWQTPSLLPAVQEPVQSRDRRSIQ